MPVTPFDPGAFPPNLLESANTWIDEQTFSSDIIASTGIKLGGVASANLLDDYETSGTFTPTLSGLSGGSGETYAVQNGTFIKIGDMVMCQVFLQMASLGTLSGQALLGGLPFTTKSGANNLPSGSVSFGSGLSLPRIAAVVWSLNANDTKGRLRIWNATTGTADLDVTEISASGLLLAAISYLT